MIRSTLAIAMVLLLVGCDHRAADALVIATPWPSAERARIESEFAGWLGRAGDPSAPSSIVIDWLILAPGDPLEGLATRRDPPDVLLGGPASVYEHLAQAGRLAPLPVEGSPAWAVARERLIRVMSPSVGRPDAGEIAFDDPRSDPVSRRWAEAQLSRRGFPEGYAELVRAAGHGPRIGRRTGSAGAALDRGDADRAVEIVPSDQEAPSPDAIPWPEGVAILNAGQHPERAEAFVKFLGRTGRVRPASGPAGEASPELLADLLGATLVDAQDELWSAWEALERRGTPAEPLRWMTEPPPWPPAFVARTLGRQDEQGMAMIESLAGQLATDPPSRAWLLSSWLSTSRPIDRALLEDLERAADGRLIREPRFRAWLRAEWTAWARQRYRRVRRVVVSQFN